MPIRRYWIGPAAPVQNALGRIHFAGAPIVAMAMTDSPYTQAEADYNAAAGNVGRPAATNQETLRNRTKLRKVKRFEGKEGPGVER